MSVKNEMKIIRKKNSFLPYLVSSGTDLWSLECPCAVFCFTYIYFSFIITVYSLKTIYMETTVCSVSFSISLTPYILWIILYPRSICLYESMCTKNNNFVMQNLLKNKKCQNWGYLSHTIIPASCPHKEIHGQEIFNFHTNQSYVSHHSVSAVVVPVLSCSSPEPWP